MKLRVGQGIDVHAFQSGRKLILGGVEIEFDRGLIGHSDADVLIHAIMDALLGATGMEDIGELFPDTDSSFKDANSLLLLEQVMSRITQDGWEVINIDSTLLLEAPRIAPYRKQMVTNISTALGIPVENCTVKATTMETLGSIGRGEGVIASCVVLLQKS